MDIKSKTKSTKEKLESEYLNIEARTDISESEKIDLIIRNTSIACSAVAIQPIPFADILVLTPIQAYMGSRIASIKGIPLNESDDLIKEVLGTLGLAMGAQQTALGLYKLGLPGLGGLMTIPLVYGLTYGIGHVMDYYFTEKRKNSAFKLSKDEIQSLWKQAKEKGEKIGEEIDIKKPKKNIFKALYDQIIGGLDTFNRQLDKVNGELTEFNNKLEKYNAKIKLETEEAEKKRAIELKEFDRRYK